MPCLVSMGLYRADLNACICGMSIPVQHISITRIFNSSSSKTQPVKLLGHKSPDKGVCCHPEIQHLHWPHHS